MKGTILDLNEELKTGQIFYIKVQVRETFQLNMKLIITNM